MISKLITIPYNKTNEKLNFSKLVFYTEDEIKEIMYNEDTYQIASILKYNYENNIDNSKYIQELKEKNLNLSFLKNTLIFMISKGIPQSVILQKEFDLNTDDIELSVFRKGFNNGINGLGDSELLVRFVNLYKNKQELLEEIGSIDLIMLFDLVNYYGLEFKKFNKEKENIILNNFKKDFKRKKLFDIINKSGMYDWYEVSGSLFENNELAFRKLQNIFNLTKDEKELFENLKQSYFFESFQIEIQLIIEKFYDLDFSKINEYILNDSFEEINYKLFINKIHKLLVGITIKDNYSIVFLDISGKKINFNFGNNIEFGGYNYNLLEREDFFKDIIKCFGEFSLNLKRNNMDFTILIFKENGDKDDIPNEYNYFLAA